MSERQIIVASNRGPIAFSRDEEGNVVARRGGGGLVTALTSALQSAGGLWIASAMSEVDREQAEAGRLEVATDGASHDVRYLSFEPSVYDGFYNGISNRLLWFVHHYLWDLPRAPRWGEELLQAWQDYRRVNLAFAEALAQEGGAVSPEPAYLVQDYHLSLVPALLRELRPNARVAHFSHVPFAGPGYFRAVPEPIRRELLAGLLGADVIGFHTAVWAEHFLLCCRELPEASVNLRRRTVRWQQREILVRVYPISVDAEVLEEEASSKPVAAAGRRLRRWLGEARLILRVDRTDLSKNILRGLLAVETLLRRNRKWRGKVLHLALLNPSREALPEYRSYVRECVRTADRINEELGTRAWQPIRIELKDDLPGSLAAYGLYDVLLVNPVFDGMNLVAKEGPVLNRKDGVLVLSENAGAFPELGRYATAINPFDVGATADALAEALDMDPQERSRRATGLRAAVLRNTLQSWVKRQLDDLSEPGHAR